MRISECLLECLSDLSFQVIGEEPVESLGILESTYRGSICSFLEDKKYIQKIPSNVRMLFLTKEMLENMEMGERGYIVVEQPRNTFFLLHNAMKKNGKYIRKTFPTKISREAKISEWAKIADKNVIIQAGVRIEPFVTIYENTVIEEECVIRSGAKIGGIGFEQKRMGDRIFLVEHFGGTILKRGVEVQNNTCIDRAIYPWDNTVIGEDTKIDNLVHIGHAAKLGRACMVVAQSGVGGRVVIGDYVWIGFGCIIRNGIMIGDKARINMGSVVSKSVANEESVTGNFAIPHEKFIRNLKSISGKGSLDI
ncbi:MAG: UDP-3-O-(3-hydroxymyristoyl)glucosamine N-acyltransferase [Lachnospiraceae bacterium]|nr:UDP-3-O-(3-hydroxymyristoyl)glucosamine N-acyltransferase [Lachnospiraceae bacterium]